MELSQPERKHGEALAAQVRSLLAIHLDVIGFASNHALFLTRIERFAALIALWGARINLTAEHGDPAQIVFHIIDSLMPVALAEGDEFLRPAFLGGSRVLDLGSGAGFPGLVLASASPAKFTLIESRRKRASFLTIAAAEMGLKNVDVDLRRIAPHPDKCRYGEERQTQDCATSVGTGARFDVVTARAFANASRFYSIAPSALKPGGLAIFFANPGQDLQPSEAVRNDLHQFRLLSYGIPRSQSKVQRLLALWRRR
jgi:16S rRNA (guanine(527)-N(7))-methyltransferase RsmG